MARSRPGVRARARLGASVLILALGFAGVSTGMSGAWFTASTQSTAAIDGALLRIGNIGASDEETIAVSQISPMTDAQAAQSSRSEWINVRNTGTIPLDWTLSVIAPTAASPLGADALAKFRFQLYDTAGTALSDVTRLGDMPAQIMPDSVPLTRGAALAAGADTRVELRMWLATDAGNEFQGASASYTVVLNGMQVAAAPAAPVTLTATPSGDPSGTRTALSWTDASPSLLDSGVTGAPTYTVQRATSASFADAATIYTGPALQATDTVSGATAAAAYRATAVESYGWGDANYAVIDGAVHYWGTVVRGNMSGSARWFSTATPTKLEGVQGTVKTIAAGKNHVCVLNTAGTVYCAGFNEDGQLANGTTVSTTDTRNAAYVADLKTVAAPIQDPDGVFRGKTITDVTSGDGFSCALTTDGTVGCWGQNTLEELGPGTLADRLAKPIKVALGSTAKAVAITSTGGTTCVAFDPAAVTRGNNVKCWGWYGDRQLGTATGTVGSSTATPTAIADPSGVLVGTTSLAGGYGTICALTNITTATNVACWGSGERGELGDGGYQDSAIPKRISLAGNVQFRTLALGFGTGCGSSSSTLYCWGGNTNGQLGSGTPSFYSTALPTAVVDAGRAITGSTIASTTVGGDHACAVNSSGALACWGADAALQRAQATTGGAGISVAPQTAQLKSGASTVKLDGTAVACASGASVVAPNGCSLIPGKTYHYRMTYAVPSVPGWTSQAVTATR